MASPEIVVEPRPAQLAADVAERTIRVLSAAQRERGLAHLVVTGGSILELVLAAIRASPARSLDWSRVAVWWGDERFVAADSDERNDRAAYDLLFSHVSIAPENLHRMPAVAPEGDGPADASAAAASYAADLAASAEPDSAVGVPQFDVVLLGIGPDGHCASLFPGHPALGEDGSVVAVSGSPKPPPVRLSLTFAALRAAREVWVIASGEAKAAAVAKALGGADPMEVPVSGARGSQRTIWFLDNDAASLLP